MPKKQPTPFGTENSAPDNVPTSTQGMQRPTINLAAGTSALARAKGTPKVNAANANTANLFAGSWSGDGSLHGW